MREEFWKKLGDNDRKFMWFFGTYIVSRDRNPAITYQALYKQARGIHLRTMCEELKDAIKEYLEEK